MCNFISTGVVALIEVVYVGTDDFSEQMSNIGGSQGQFNGLTKDSDCSILDLITLTQLSVALSRG